MVAIVSSNPPIQIHPALDDFCQVHLVQAAGQVQPRKMLDDVEMIVRSDRWISFDRFDETAEFLRNRLEENGLQAEIEHLPTSPMAGDGRWRIPERWTVRRAHLDLVDPLPMELADWHRQPFSLITWSRATPAEGLAAELVILDRREEIEGLRTGELDRKFVLTRLEVRPIRRRLVEAGALGIITDAGVRFYPEAVLWQKFGWGGWPFDPDDLRCIGFSLSRETGRALRRAISGRKASVHALVDCSFETGTHPMVTGLLKGASAPREEICIVAHAFEPGAGDNASGVATAMEAARLIATQIEMGHWPAPRRSIRLLCGYENYGSFQRLEEGESIRPLAGIDVDVVGVRHELCNGRMTIFRAPACQSAFMDEVAQRTFNAANKLCGANYSMRLRPMMGSGDDLANDPIFGFPLPWVSTFPYRSYHSSADLPSVLCETGLAAAAVGLAGYAYWLAAASDGSVQHLAEQMASKTRRALPGILRRQGPAGVECALQRLSITLESAKAWAGNLSDAASRARLLRSCSRRADALLGDGDWRGAIRKSVAGQHRLADRIVRRIRPLMPMHEAISPDLCAEYQRLCPSPAALYYANGERDVRTLAGLIALETGQPPDLVRTAEYFDLLSRIGSIEFLQEPNEEPT